MKLTSAFSLFSSSCISHSPKQSKYTRYKSLDQVEVNKRLLGNECIRLHFLTGLYRLNYNQVLFKSLHCALLLAGKAPQDVHFFVNQDIRSFDDIRRAGSPFAELRYEFGMVTIKQTIDSFSSTSTA